MRVWTSETTTGSDNISMSYDADEAAVVNDPPVEATTTMTAKKRKTTTSSSRADKAVRKKARAEEKARIRAQLPKVDEETGLAYTKQQIRRMGKRVARGLHPIETPAEIHERRMRESELKKEEEAEFAGLYVAQKKERPTVDPSATTKSDDDNDEDDEDSVRSNSSTNKTSNHNQEDGDQNDLGEATTNDERTSDQSPPLVHDTIKKKTRCKPVPDDYVCSACQNAITPAHWIYDCPQKKSSRNNNNAASGAQQQQQLRGVHDPSEKKLFVSGLPFEANVGYVKQLFTNQSGVTPTFVKLVKFKDSERCRGQAYLSFASAMDAKTALQEMDGQRIVQSSSSDSTTKTNPSSSAATDNNTETKRPKKDLHLSVTYVLNRVVTSKKKKK